MSGDKLVVGYRESVRDMCAAMSSVNEHSCHDQNAMGIPEMAKALWASGYRFDPDARIQWLLAELRSSLDGSLSEMFNELIRLIGRFEESGESR